MSNVIVQKAYEIILDRLDEGYLSDHIVCFADSRNKEIPLCLCVPIFIRPVLGVGGGASGTAVLCGDRVLAYCAFPLTTIQIMACIMAGVILYSAATVRTASAIA